MGFFDRFRRDKTADLVRAIEATSQPVIRRLPRQRYFEAAKVTNLTASWSTQPVPVDLAVYQGWRQLVARAREQAANNELARKFVAMCKNHIVGAEGFTFQAKTKNRRGEPDTRTNDQLEFLWKDWGRIGNCDVTGQLSWTAAQKLMVGQFPTDGECFVRMYKGREFGPYAFQLQFIDPLLLDIEHNEILTNGNQVVFGVEYDRMGKPVAYHFNKQYKAAHPTAGYQVNIARTRVPAAEIVHVFDMERVGQKRGIPWMATSAVAQNMLNGFEEAAVVNARVGASKMGFMEGYDEDLDGDGYGYNGEPVEDAEPGSFHQVPQGFQFHAFDPKFPDQQMGPFSKVVKQRIASGYLVSYNTLANDLEGVNFSSMRHGAIEDREQWLHWQRMVHDQAIDRIYREWVQVQVGLLGRIPHEGPIFPKFGDVKFQGRRWGWIDPRAEAQANQVEIQLGTKSRSQVIRERGQDPDDVYNEIADENRKFADLGITLESQTPADTIGQETGAESNGTENDETGN